MAKKIAILGLGWLGLPLAKTLFDKGYEITGSTTRSEKLMGLLQSRFSIRIIKITKNNVEGNWKKLLTDIDYLVLNVPPGRKNNPLENYPLMVEQIVRRCSPDLKVIFVSSTSVYGENSGGIVDENTVPKPESDSGKAMLEAEGIVKNHFGANATILRFAGLFGQDRHPGRFLSPDKPLKNPNGSINLIHQNDCISLIEKILEKDTFGETINGCADEHPIRSDFYKKAAFDLSLDGPTYNEDLPAEGKIVSNEKSKALLGIEYQFSDPTLFFES